ncbi:MAG: HAD-IIB family hydrolase [Erysipelotrichaceae bacterium]|nr:HAD-IIB family hydrolase [Erysipelotrichaceae bacterium]
MIDKISVMAADIDGTLCAKGDIPAEINIRAMEELHKRSVRIGLASGRPYDPRLREYSNSWGLSFDFDFLICANGGELWMKETPDQIYRYYRMKKETVGKIVRKIDELDLNAICYIDGYSLIYALKMDWLLEDSQKRNNSHVEIVPAEVIAGHDVSKIECRSTPDRKKDVDRLLAELHGDDFKSVVTYPGTLEFVDPRVNKGMCLQKYCEMTGIPIEETLTFGDMNNDYELIRDGGLGVALLNGCDDCKNVADAVTDYDAENGGVGHFIFDHCL